MHPQGYIGEVKKNLKKIRTWPKETIEELPVGSTSREILIASDVARS